ncbi:MAG: DUF2203 domain-containing protein [Deltaproteobacteria bacterium]|nr:DUF2203 domain-containing protein [Deltaproteobacteria bacterium]
MASTPRFFTFEEASALLPRVKAVVARQLERRTTLEQLISQLATRLGTAPDTVVIEPDDPDDLKSLKRDLIARIEEYQRGWNELEDLGAVLKDARTGLIDFFSRVEGKTVLLCWRHGEDAIEHYHDVDSGFAGRKPLAAVRTRLYN